MDAKFHPILHEAWTYELVGFRFDSTRRESTLELVLKRERDVRRLQFLGPREIILDPTFARGPSGIAILDLRGDQLEGVGVRVSDVVGGHDCKLTFYARDVIDSTPARAVPVAPDAVAAKEWVKQFCAEVHQLKSIHNLRWELFESEDGPRSIDGIANAFFHDLGDVLDQYFLLAAERVCQPAQNGRQSNLTLDFLLEAVAWPGRVRERVTKLRDKVDAFRDHIMPARHKLIAHLSVSEVVAGETLGAFPEGADEEFLDSVEQLCDAFHEASFGSINGEMVVQGPGDVLDLKEALRKSRAFDQLFSEADVDKQVELLNLLRRLRETN